MANLWESSFLFLFCKIHAQGLRGGARREEQADSPAEHGAQGRALFHHHKIMTWAIEFSLDSRSFLLWPCFSFREFHCFVWKKKLMMDNSFYSSLSIWKMELRWFFCFVSVLAGMRKSTKYQKFVQVTCPLQT